MTNECTHRDIDATKLAARLGAGDEPFVLDVREPAEVGDWTIVGAVNIPAARLANESDRLPRDREIVVVCASGTRSAPAAELLARQGFQAANLRGGMAAWGTVYDRAELVLDGGVHIVQVRRRGKGCLSYVVGAGAGAFVVDPSLNLDVYVDVAAEHGWRITRVFDTHLHADHVSGARLLAVRTGATLHLNPVDAFAFDYVPLRDGETFVLGAGVHVEVAALCTPGHTQGSTMFFVGGRAVLTGDTLFVDGVGRPDLAERAGEFAHTLYRSLHERVLTLPDRVRVLPGHYRDAVRVRPGVPVGATVGELRRTLAPLSYDEDAFVAWATERVTARPPNYVEIVGVNLGRSDRPLPELARLEAGPNRCSV